MKTRPTPNVESIPRDEHFSSPSWDRWGKLRPREGKRLAQGETAKKATKLGAQTLVSPQRPLNLNSSLILKENILSPECKIPPGGLHRGANPPVFSGWSGEKTDFKTVLVPKADVQTKIRKAGFSPDKFVPRSV